MLFLINVGERERERERKRTEEEKKTSEFLNFFSKLLNLPFLVVFSFLFFHRRQFFLLLYLVLGDVIFVVLSQIIKL